MSKTRELMVYTLGMTNGVHGSWINLVWRGFVIAAILHAVHDVVLYFE